MSTIIQPVAPVSVAAAVQPVAETTNQAASGDIFVITDPTVSASAPVTIEAPETGAFEVAAGSTQANVVIEGEGTAVVGIGNAQTAGGGLLDASGSAFQIADTYKGTVVANLSGAIVDGVSKVDVSTVTPGGGSIGSNLPGGASSSAFASSADIDYYVNTGSANDQIEGSKGNDFIRCGAGDDVFNSGGGNDIVRTGAGNDTGSLGAGNDILYFTIDQLQGSQTKTITDFDANGDDKIQIASELQSRVTISGQGTNALKIVLSGPQTGTTAVVSEGATIDADDIEFV